MGRSDQVSNALEDKLIKKAINGDAGAFESLIVPYEKKVYNIALQMFKNEHDAYDASQEVLIKVYRNLSKFKFESAFSTWLHRLAMNTCIDEYRKRKRHITHTTSMDQQGDYSDAPLRQFKDPNRSPEELLLQQEVVGEVRQAMDCLKAEQKMIIIYRDINGMTYDEIAQIYECSLGTVKSRIARARKSLKDQIILMRQHLNDST